jgi:hypothetical protein
MLNRLSQTFGNATETNLKDINYGALSFGRVAFFSAFFSPLFG